MTTRFPVPIRLLSLRCERGAAAVEYALLASLIVLAMVEGAMALGGGSEAMWTNVDEQASTAMGTTDQAANPAGTPANGKPKKPKK